MHYRQAKIFPETVRSCSATDACIEIAGKHYLQVVSKRPKGSSCCVV